MINGRAIRLSYSSARNWNKDDGNATSSDASARYNVIMEGPEIPNIKPPPPTLDDREDTLEQYDRSGCARGRVRKRVREPDVRLRPRVPGNDEKIRFL